MQYIGSAATPYWKFADNQWDYLGTITGQNGSNQNVDRDLFGWGTSGINHGSVCYQPWSVSQNNNDYYVYGSFSYNLFDQTGQADWGYNAISNGGNNVNEWRTLTVNEENYILFNRSTSSGIRFAKACVNYVQGVILLPDNWNIDMYSLNKTNQRWASFDSNIISASQMSALEEAGVVFLPVGGRRDGILVEYVRSRGDYWLADSDSGGVGAYGIFFDDNYLGGILCNRYFGLSVRLVQDHNP